MSIFYMLLIVSNLVNLTFQTFLVVFGMTLPMHMAYIQIFCQFTLYSIFLLTLTEITWLKFLHMYVWKSVRPLDEGFVVTCCTLNNVVFSALFSIAWIQSNGGKVLIMTITNPFEWHMTYWITEENVNDNYFR